jgi:hypothetical protein
MDEQRFVRYLAAKKSVDDRALNRRVWDAMIAGAARPSPRVLELGGGIGTMIERVIADGRLAPRSWTLVDSQGVLVEEAWRRLAGGVPFDLELVACDLDEYAGRSPAPRDLVIANAFLDLFDPPRILRQIRPLGTPSAHFLFSITFDGLTAMEPEIDPDLDTRVIQLYHRTMDERMTAGMPSGDSRCGRHLLTLLPGCGYRIVEAGSSDWIVYPRDHEYPADERFFLSCILGFFEESLSSRHELGRGELARWLKVRRDQLAAGELVFIAHQLDVLAVAMEA